VKMAAALLQDTAFNPHYGSVAVEKVQNVLKEQNPSLLKLVLAVKQCNFNQFIDSHPEHFHMFARIPNKMRMRHVLHTNWEAADAQAEAEREALNVHITHTLAAHLKTQPRYECSVDSFILAYPTLPCNLCPSGEPPPYVLPKRGDLVRFIRSRSDLFAFVETKFLIRLADAAPHPAAPKQFFRGPPEGRHRGRRH
jgi:hypothetical protein